MSFFPGSPRVPTADEQAIRQEITDWARRFLVPPNPGMRRHGDRTPAAGEPICPFVKPSLDRALCFFEFRWDVTGAAVEEIVGAIAAYSDRFPRELTPEQQRQHDDVSLIVVLPSLEPKYYIHLNLARRRLKEHFVAAGLMVAQLYPDAPWPSIHNRSLKVYGAPYPMFVIRYMAVHDVLFLGADKESFSVYCRHFAEVWERPEGPPRHLSHLVPVYRAARERFGALR